jgi:predicted transposase/invertase (TIGR01784 family)
MKFINPKTDYAFKKIFGSDESHDILLSFLNAIIYQGQAIIQSLEIIDPYAPGRISGLKTTYFDVKAKLHNGQRVLIEMQAFTVPAFSERMFYNTAKMYVNQLKIGETYPELVPSIGVAIIDFTIFNQTKEVISSFGLKEEKLLFDYPEVPVKLVYVELPKFQKKLEELANIGERWLYFLQKARELEEVPSQMSEIPEINQAFTIANRINLSAEELEDIERREMFVREQKGSIELSRETALAEGRELGIVEGRELGMAEGRELGIAEGQQLGQLNLIKRQLGRKFGELTPEIDSMLAQLSRDRLTILAEAMFDLADLADLLTWLETHQNLP